MRIVCTLSNHRLAMSWGRHLSFTKTDFTRFIEWFKSLFSFWTITKKKQEVCNGSKIKELFIILFKRKCFRNSIYFKYFRIEKKSFRVEMPNNFPVIYVLGLYQIKNFINYSNVGCLRFAISLYTLFPNLYQLLTSALYNF